MKYLLTTILLLSATANAWNGESYNNNEFWNDGYHNEEFWNDPKYKFEVNIKVRKPLSPSFNYMKYNEMQYYRHLRQTYQRPASRH